ncbi:rhomboid family intramembrane serine protease [Salirhabdus salicampi]|uniref:rhomboid family intramembrane serine protease n=1 Tax=Salirhabdus salicampi TaxID=476102 RepID=UPI0020C480DC|nr:rhomboid family intramembrane serine protease [Salirhabdus salicampi]MCP8618095.1 rhomboid family intramembrane serine protease [Salirhabdus salicampi]
MFIRTESFQEFTRLYPIVTVLVGIHLILWLFTDIIPLPFLLTLTELGIGQNWYIQHEQEYWRLITAIFFHFGFGHMLFNSFSLILFGPALERLLGKGKFITAYLIAGFTGNIATLWLGSPFVTHAGASGAIFGLFGVYLFIVLYRKYLLDYQNTQIIITIMIFGFIMTFIQTNINIYAHLFGFIGGFLIAHVIVGKSRTAEGYGYNTRPRIRFNPNRWRKRAFGQVTLGKLLLWGFFILLVLFGIVGRFL